MNRFRKLKIYKKFQPREWKYIPVPEIRLEGKWLKELGFEIGKEIEIKQQKNKLTITLTDKKEEKQLRPTSAIVHCLVVFPSEKPR